MSDSFRETRTGCTRRKDRRRQGFGESAHLYHRRVRVQYRPYLIQWRAVLGQTQGVFFGGPI
jgi:hypothetical protein